MTMYEDYVTFEQALKLKELEFDWKCNHYYDSSPQILHEECQSYLTNYSHTNNTSFISAPTLAQVQKWLREKYKFWLEPVICFTNINRYSCDIYDLKTADEENYIDEPITDIEGTFNTPEEALSAGIDKALELIKT